GPPRRRTRGIPAGDRGRGDAADHPLLGGVVELAAPGPDHPRVRRVVDGREHAAAAAVDDRRHQAVGGRLAAGPRPRRQPAARGRQGLGAPRRWSGAMSYAGYVVAAYAVFAAVLPWDFVAPRIRIAQVLRAVRLLARRDTLPPRHDPQDLQRRTHPPAG